MSSHIIASRSPQYIGAPLLCLTFWAALPALAQSPGTSGSTSARTPAAQVTKSGQAAGFRLGAWPAHAPSPDFDLRDEAGRRRRLADFQGKLVVVFFGFMRCPDVCPAELFRLAQVHKRVADLSPALQVLFVTLDPDRDTHDDLRKYVASFDPTFVGLTGTAKQIDSAAEAFHVRYARVQQAGGYTIDHSTASYVFDQEGRLRLIATPHTSIDDFVHDLNLLAADAGGGQR